MSTTERDEVAALLPPPPTERDVPGAAAQRAGLLRELSRTPSPRFRLLAPVLAAAAVVLVVALTAGVGLFFDHRSGGEVAAPPGPDQLTGLLDRLPATEALPYPSDGFVYVREVTVQGVLSEHWYSVDASKAGLVRTDGAATPLTYDPLPAGLTAAEQLALRPTLARLRAARTRYTPAQLTAALSARRPPEQVFALLERFLAEGGLADPDVRTWLYRAAGLVDGAFSTPDITVAGQNATGVSLTVGGVTRRILFDPATGTLSATGAAHEAPGDLDHTYLGFGPAAGAGKPPVTEVRSVESPNPSSVRDVDFRNDAWELPLDLSRRPLVTPGTAAGGPIANFTDGVARLPTDDEWPLQFTIKQPVAYLQPTPKQVGAADGPVPETAIAVVEIRPTEPGNHGLAYTAVVGFAGVPGDRFPGPVSLVALISGPVSVTVTTTGDTVTIAGGRMPPQHYVRRGEGFTQA